MKSWPIAVLFALGLSACAPAAEKEAAWLTDYDKAKAAARASGKPIFLVFR